MCGDGGVQDLVRLAKRSSLLSVRSSERAFTEPGAAACEGADSYADEHGIGSQSIAG